MVYLPHEQMASAAVISVCYSANLLQWQRFAPFSCKCSVFSHDRDLLFLLFSESVFESVNLSIMTEIWSSHIQRVSVWISKSFYYDRDLHFSYPESQCLNQWIIHLWQRLALFLSSESVFESVNHSIMTEMCSFLSSESVFESMNLFCSLP